ncbi:MAG TPA: AraC family transcriptional regulator [Solirubrobacteraceae bacterium]|nr:AraC family transcriptional regulator [Solirubrobacteraceae bacterium]
MTFSPSDPPCRPYDPSHCSPCGPSAGAAADCTAPGGSAVAGTDGLELDRLPGERALEVSLMEHASVFGAASARAPHRHDYHELGWVRHGWAVHLIDGRPYRVPEGSVSVIGRGRVHVLAQADGLTGALVRFGDELLGADCAAAATAWWVDARRPPTVSVPPGEVARLEALLEALAAERAGPPDRITLDVQRHLLITLLLWTCRWHRLTWGERATPDVDAELHQRFLALLEREFAAHHDAGHYADLLAVPAARLARALVQVSGRTTKELITDRVMLEASRLLLFSTLSVSQIAYRVGFDDPFYFSRAFKRTVGHSPLAYRDRGRGAALAGPARRQSGEQIAEVHAKQRKGHSA